MRAAKLLQTGRAASIAATLLLLVACGQQPIPAPVEDVTAPPTVEPLPEENVTRPDYHQVSKGETLLSIALNYGLDYRDLALWNNLRNPNLINVDQQLRLTAPAGAATATPVQSVNAGRLVQVESAADAAALTPVVPNASTAATGNAAAAAGNAAATAAQVIVQSTVVGLAAPAPSADALANAPLKTTPVAAKFIYSPNLLNTLRRQWQSQARARASRAPAPKPVAAATPRTAPTAASDGKAPQQTRERFNIQWSYPTANKMSGRFSERSKGINFTGERGQPVYASASGEVIYVGTGVKSYGQMVIVKHANEYLTAYAHIDKAFVKEGDNVRRGSRIAAFGDSGSDKVMLHFEVRKVGKPIDPLQVLPTNAQ